MKLKKNMNRLNDITKVHAKYYANELTIRKSYGSDEKIAESLFDSVLHINPHQIDAALFAFRSPLSKGVILADEVGLGKTIEAGLIMSQYWAEGKKRQIVICPASIRKQWSMELKEKFNLDSIILEKKEVERRKKEVLKNPFLENKVLILSYHFAANVYEEIMEHYFDLVIIDEAHRLRNVYKKNNKMANNIRMAFKGSKKILLTATPLQNNLLELYGLTTFISEQFFGDEKSFKGQYIKENNNNDLKERLHYFCKRTLRKDVLEYVKYTDRKAILKEFKPTKMEDKLYNGVSELLLREDAYSIPKAQKKLTTLMIRKLLASSSYAVKQTLITIKSRLEALYKNENIKNNIIELLDEDEQIISEELCEEGDVFEADAENVVNKERLFSEIKELDELIKLASNITIDAKSYSLLESLKLGFDEMERTGVNRKALIFTESRRTQDYLKAFLETNGFKGKICIFNGSNNSEETKIIYDNWFIKNKNTGRISGSKTADKRNAIIEYFKEEAEIMIATESASEGVNLQFCSFVVNYDMPWNPQRIEQRIGRCHRYGQKNDVVVINFVNMNNYADQRVYALLKEKFRLFEGVFGTSDEILGTVESGVDFEKEILSIYQSCRTKKEIDDAFKTLQKSMEKEISQSIQRVEKEIFTNFDVSVQDKLMTNITGYLDRFGRMFWNLTKYEIGDKAIFDDKKKEFRLKNYYNNASPGLYEMVDKVKSEEEYEGFIYRISHPLGHKVIENNLRRDIPKGKLYINISEHKGASLSVLEKMRGHSGTLLVSRLALSSFDFEEELIFVGLDKSLGKLDENIIKTFFECKGKFDEEYFLSSDEKEGLKESLNEIISYKTNQAKLRNVEFVKEEEIKLARWAEDKIISLENEIDSIKKNLREIQKKLLEVDTQEEHLLLNTRLMKLNRKKRNMREEMETNEDKIEIMRFNLIKEIKKKGNLIEKNKELFEIAWEVI